MINLAFRKASEKPVCKRCSENFRAHGQVILIIVYCFAGFKKFKLSFLFFSCYIFKICIITFDFK